MSLTYHFEVQTRGTAETQWNTVITMRPAYERRISKRRFLYFFTWRVVEIPNKDEAEQAALTRAVNCAERHSALKLMGHRWPWVRVLRVERSVAGMRRYVIWKNGRFLS